MSALELQINIKRNTLYPGLRLESSGTWKDTAKICRQVAALVALMSYLVKIEKDDRHSVTFEFYPLNLATYF